MDGHDAIGDRRGTEGRRLLSLRANAEVSSGYSHVVSPIAKLMDHYLGLLGHGLYLDGDIARGAGDHGHVHRSAAGTRCFQHHVIDGHNDATHCLAREVPVALRR